MISSTNIRPD